MTLRELETGKSAVIRRVGGEGALRQHFLDMGMIPGAGRICPGRGKSSSEREPLACLQALRFSCKLFRYAKGPIPEGAVCAADWGS